MLENIGKVLCIPEFCLLQDLSTVHILNLWNVFLFFVYSVFKAQMLSVIFIKMQIPCTARSSWSVTFQITMSVWVNN